jgi:hypothetical protein
MDKSLELVLRKSLDAADRRRTFAFVALIVLGLVAVFTLIAMNQIPVNNMQDLRLQLIAGFTGIALLIAAIGAAVIAVQQRNTALVLKAMTLLYKPD